MRPLDSPEPSLRSIPQRPSGSPGWLLLAVLTLGVVTACDEGVPTFPPVERDRARECDPGGGALGGGAPMDGGTSAGGCAAGQMCLEGRCYARCDDDSGCSLRERCSEGACVPRPGPIPMFDGGQPDAGFDSGPPDLCEEVDCSPTPTLPVCHPRSGECVACTAEENPCLVTGGVCDIARATCALPVAEVDCAPCNEDNNCRTDPEDPSFECVVRELNAQGAEERVCLRTCDPTGDPCPSETFECVGGHCVPAVGGTCTGLRAAIEDRACADDAVCAPLFATPGDVLFVGACDIPAEEEAGVCRQPCGTNAECANGAFTCQGAGFCRP